MNEIHLPTISGIKNIISVPAGDGASIGQVTTEYCAQLDQAAAADPVPVIVIDTINEVGGFPITWSRTGAGTYQGFKAGAFLGNNWLSSNNGFLALGQTNSRISKVDDDNILLETYDLAGAPVDDWQVFVSVKKAVAQSTDEEIFNYLLTQLDANQLLMWTKIVIRYLLLGVATVVEVDGKIWRKTGVFATSSVIINS